jgi:hypothetical protein
MQDVKNLALRIPDSTLLTPATTSAKPGPCTSLDQVHLCRKEKDADSVNTHYWHGLGMDVVL